LYTTGNAVRLAAEDAKKQVFRLAAPLLKVQPKDLEARDRKIYVKGAPDRSISHKEVLEKAAMGVFLGPYISGLGNYTPNADEERHYIYAAGFAEVIVDIETGQVDLVKFISSQDWGKVINPLVVENQTLGGNVQGIGWSLTEDYSLDNHTGYTLSNNYMYYGIPSILDICEQDVLVIEQPWRLGPFGAKGGGEATMIYTAPAILNAISNAIGVRLREIPVTPEKILKALKKTGG
jgi:xanthine dehydrogenase molybdenum-binding subunit